MVNLVTKPHAAMKRLNLKRGWDVNHRFRYKTARGYEALKRGLAYTYLKGSYSYKTARGYEALKPFKNGRTEEGITGYKTARGYEALKLFFNNFTEAQLTLVTKPHAAMKRLNSVP